MSNQIKNDLDAAWNVGIHSYHLHQWASIISAGVTICLIGNVFTGLEFYDPKASAATRSAYFAINAVLLFLLSFQAIRIVAIIKRLKLVENSIPAIENFDLDTSPLEEHFKCIFSTSFSKFIKIYVPLSICLSLLFVFRNHALLFAYEGGSPPAISSILCLVSYFAAFSLIYCLIEPFITAYIVLFKYANYFVDDRDQRKMHSRYRKRLSQHIETLLG